MKRAERLVSQAVGNSARLGHLAAAIVERCPPGCPKCAAEYLDEKEREEHSQESSRD